MDGEERDENRVANRMDEDFCQDAGDGDNCLSSIASVIPKRPPIPSFHVGGLSISTNSSTTETDPARSDLLLSQEINEELRTHVEEEGPSRRSSMDFSMADNDEEEEAADVESLAGVADNLFGSNDDLASSGSSDDSDDDSGSDDDDEARELPSVSLQDRMSRNQQRNSLFLEALNEKYRDQIDPKVLQQRATKTYKRKRSKTDKETVVVEAPRGMLRIRAQKKQACESTTATKSASLSQQLRNLTERYPHREGPIRQLMALLHGTICGQTPRRLSQYSLTTGIINVPAPIFVSGPRGSGKTAVVRDVLSLLEQEQQRPDGKSPSRYRMATAYVNCSIIEPSSIERLVLDAYQQLRPRSGLRRRKRKRRKNTCLEPASNKESSTVMADVSGAGSTTASVQKETKAESDPTYELRDGTPSEPPAATAEENDAMMAENLSLDLQDSSQPRLQPRRAAKQAVATKATTAESKGKAAAKSAAKASSGATNQRRSGNSVETSHSAVVAFGRSLQPYFGIGAFQSSSCAAVLVLDHAERLLSLSARKQPYPKTNCLAELLLLPKIMRLNLTIIVISGYSILRSTRLDNLAAIDHTSATLVSVGWTKVDFPAYKGNAVFQKILKTQHLLNQIVGFQYQIQAKSNLFKSKVIDAFLSTLVQMVSDSTRDIKEFIRLGRSLWPLYVEPLHPKMISLTWKELGVDSLKIMSGNEELDSRLLGFLGRRFLGYIGKVSGDLTQLPIDSPLSCSGLASIDFFSQSLVSRNFDSSRHPFLRTCLLLAAFICQHNRADQDKKIFSAHGNGKRRNRRTGCQNDDENVAFGSSSADVEQLKSLRPRPFLVERAFSIFVTLVRLNPDNQHALPRRRRKDYTPESLGSTRLYQDLQQLVDLGFLHPVVYAGAVRGEQVNLNGTKYWCSLAKHEAMGMANEIGVPLDSYLV